MSLTRSVVVAIVDDVSSKHQPKTGQGETGGECICGVIITGAGGYPTRNPTYGVHLGTEIANALEVFDLLKEKEQS